MGTRGCTQAPINHEGGVTTHVPIFHKRRNHAVVEHSR